MGAELRRTGQHQRRPLREQVARDLSDRHPRLDPDGDDPPRLFPVVRLSLAQGESVIWTDNDSNDSKVTMQTPKE